MAQLRSFKYLEPDEGQQSTNGDDLSSSSSPTNSLGDGGGGNLTSGSSDRSATYASQIGEPLDTQAGQTPPPPQLVIKVAAVGDQTSSLDSNEELQATYHDIIEEEETSETSGGSGGGLQQVVAPASLASQDDASLPRARINSIGEFNQSRMPLRQQLLIGRQQLNTSKQEGLKLDTLSQSSETTIQRNLKSSSPISAPTATTTNHFEIRWRHIHLYSKKSRLPDFVKQNQAYKLLFNYKNSSSNKLQPNDESVWPTPALTSKRVHLNSSGLSVSNPSSPIVGARHKLGPGLTLDIGGPPTSFALNEQQQQQQQNNEFSQLEYKSILRNINGAVFSGQLTAVLGPSGVGKTSLLNSLTGRNTLAGTGRVSLIGGASKRMAVVTVPQVDILPGKLTVLEDLRFTSRLKNPQRNFDHKRNIDRIVRHLHMEKFLKTKIDRLSGGEARRLSIGRELLSSPDIMILDEPTSGLDANTCKKIISALRDIVEHSDHILDRPMSMIVTIHQPQQEVLNLFHRVYVMAQGGRAIYEGPPGTMLNTMLEFSSLSKMRNVEDLNENPAIVALEVASGEYGPEIISELALYQESQWLFCDEQQVPPAQQPIESPNLASWHSYQSPFSTPGLAFKWPGKKLATNGGGGGAGSSVSQRFNAQQVIPLRRPHESPKLRSDWTPRSLRKVPASPASLHRHHNQLLPPPSSATAFDRLSNVTSVSFASSYDPYLPEQTTKLKVDKRLRRSVVMKGDFISQTWTLMQRAWLLSTRDLVLMSIRLIGFILIALGMAQIFGPSLDPNEHQCPIYETEISDIPGYMKQTRERLVGLKQSIVQAGSTHLFFFHLMLSISMVTSALTGLIFPLQMRMLLREHKNGWYNLSSSVMSLTLAELPIDVFAPLLCMLITYPLCHQPESPYYWREIGYCLVITFCCLICKSHAQIVGAVLMDSVENSVFAACVMISPPALLSGLAVRVSSMSWLLEITSYVSYMRYTFENLLILRYGYGICPCDPELVYGYPMKLSNDAVPSHLDGIARGFLESIQSTTTVMTTTTNATGAGELIVTTPTSENSNPFESSELTASNLFLSFVRLMTDSSNKFAPKMSDLGDCNSYRSLYLMDMGIDDRSFPTWMLILVAMFILSRFITYFTIRAVIKLRHN